MTSIQQPLPQFAPLTAVMKRDPSNPQFAGMVGGAKDGFFGNGETPWFLTTSIGSGPDATQKQSLAYWKQDGIDFVDSTEEPLTKGEAARTALAQVAQAVQQLGSPVASSVFDTAAGAEQLRTSLKETDTMVQMYANGALTTRIVGPDQEQELMELIQNALV